jgi:predicted dienelactone hydrolase
VRLIRLAATAALLTLAIAGTADGRRAEVGHEAKQLVVPGSTQGESRKVTVHLWYPAAKQALRRAPRTIYTSRLHGERLPEPWEPLSWSVRAKLARETRAIERREKPLPVIVFSHGSVNDPIDYAHTLEQLAAEGFLVAAPSHVNNTQDDVRVDFINGRAGSRLFGCLDGLDPPCSRTNLARSMDDRVRDIAAILDALPDWFGRRVDAGQAGVLGHSRGTVTALTAAGGSGTWNVSPEGRVKAIMGMAIGNRTVTSGANLGAVTVPAVLVAGGKDANSTPDVSEDAYDTITSANKLIVRLPDAVHRSFDSTYCAQLQSAGAAFDTNHDGEVEGAELTNPRPILDRHTLELIAAAPPTGISGKAVHYCAREFFTQPVDIRQLVATVDGAEYTCAGRQCVPVTTPPTPCVTTKLPCTGLDTDEVADGMAQLAAAFFGRTLRGDDGRKTGRWLSPAWLVDHVPMVGSAEAAFTRAPVAATAPSARAR